MDCQKSTFLSLEPGSPEYIWMDGRMDGRLLFSTPAATQKCGIQVQILTWFHEHPQKCDKIHSNNLRACDPWSIKGSPFIELVSRGERDGVSVSDLQAVLCSIQMSASLLLWMNHACLLFLFDR